MSALSQDEELRKQVWHPHIIQLSTYLLTLRNQLPSRAYKNLDRRLCWLVWYMQSNGLRLLVRENIPSQKDDGKMSRVFGWHDIYL